MISRVPRTLLAMLLVAAALPAQMELRDRDRFRPSVYRKLAPAVGAECPDLVVETLGGAEWSLAGVRGRRVVLVKGSFT